LFALQAQFELQYAEQYPHLDFVKSNKDLDLRVRGNVYLVVPIPISPPSNLDRTYILTFLEKHHGSLTVADRGELWWDDGDHAAKFEK
jgi:hypothetical protein